MTTPRIIQIIEAVAAPFEGGSAIESSTAWTVVAVEKGGRQSAPPLGTSLQADGWGAREAD